MPTTRLKPPLPRDRDRDEIAKTGMSERQFLPLEEPSTLPRRRTLSLFWRLVLVVGLTLVLLLLLQGVAHARTSSPPGPTVAMAMPLLIARGPVLEAGDADRPHPLNASRSQRSAHSRGFRPRPDHS